MNNRYFYLDGDGQMQGPVWLSSMRALFRNGQINMGTEVSLTGTTDWERLEFYPEITEEQAQMPSGRILKNKSNPVRLLVWTTLLFLAYVTWVIVHWDDGKRLKFHDDSASVSDRLAK